MGPMEDAMLAKNAKAVVNEVDSCLIVKLLESLESLGILGVIRAVLRNHR